MVTDRYFPCVGGRETQIELITQELITRGRQAVVFTLPPPKSTPANASLWQRLGALNLSGPSRAEYAGVPVVYPRFSLRTKWFAALRILPGVINVGLAPAVERNYQDSFRADVRNSLNAIVTPEDIVHIHETYASDFGPIAHEVALEKNAPIFYTPYFHASQMEDARLLSLFKKYAPRLNQAQGVFALLPGERDALTRFGVKAPILLCGLGLKGSATTPSGENFREKYQLGEVPYILYLGRIAREKNVGALVECAKIVGNEFPEAKFVFIGPEEYGTADEFFKEKSANVRYLGQVSESDRTNALQNCALLSLPSMNEVFPNVILEAWSFEKPVAAYPAYALCGFVDKEGAGVVAKADPRSLAEGIIRLLKDPQSREAMGRRGYELTKTRFTTEYLVDALTSAYFPTSQPVTNSRQAVRS